MWPLEEIEALQLQQLFLPESDCVANINGDDKKNAHINPNYDVDCTETENVT